MPANRLRIAKMALALILTSGLLTAYGISSMAADTKKETVKIKAKKGIKGSLKTNKYELFEPIVTQKDTTIEANKADIDNTKDKQQGRFTGDVKVKQPDVTLTCATLDAWFNLKKGTASGKVLIVREEDRTDDNGKKEKVKTTINCDKADFYTESKDFTATGSVYVVDKSTKAWADIAVYTDKDKKLQMNGNVKLEQSDGSKVNGDNIVYYTDKENIEIIGPTDMEIYID